MHEYTTRQMSEFARELAELIKEIVFGGIGLGLALLFLCSLVKLQNLIFRGYCAIVDWIRDHSRK
jgi:hypothetical protein